ncbi:MAG: tRNA (uridine(54)-C5)-methyltransferase TrmA, partial [Gammaproteobacteria bacterium]|nr:tRNA (uridine(54)-C5)-methyltransferase TrmA [Gammaproteobacteria bacterium]
MTDIDPTTYEQQLQEKVAGLQARFQGLELPPLESHPSSPLNYRMRAEFKVWQQDNRADYAMYRQGEHR